MDRHLQSKKRTIRKRQYGRTRPGHLLKHQIPIKTDQWDVREPGFVEVDLGVAFGELGDGGVYPLLEHDRCAYRVGGNAGR